jgi:hypothetical protein
MLKLILHWLIPRGFQDLLRSIRGWWTSRRAPGSVLARNEKFRNRHADGSRCFILATGPSIRTQDLSLLKGETCISLSNFIVHPHNSLIRPAYHCVPRLGFPPSTPETAAAWFREMEAKTGQATFFMDYENQWIVDRYGLFRDKELHYLSFGRNWSGLNGAGIDLTLPLPRIQSSPVMALQVAIFLGFKEIYLLGCDHDWLLHFGQSLHFYQENENPIFQQPGVAENWDLEAEARAFAVLFGQYRELLNYAGPRGIRVFNATAGGLLNVFPRVTYETLFKSGAVQ